MEIINSIDEIKSLIEESTIVILYFSTEHCNVCKTLKPKLDKLLEGFPQIVSRYVDLEKFSEASGLFTVFSIPTIIVMIEGKESIRESRNISLMQFQDKISRYYQMIYEN